MYLKRITALLLSAALLSGCVHLQSKEGAGTLVGAGAGALVGSQFGGGKGRLVGVALGTLAGAMIGQEVGRSLDRADGLAMKQNAQYALEHSPTNQSTTWVNPDSGNSGSVTPVRTYEVADNQPCREYVQTVKIGGEEHTAYGTACRQRDGSWKVAQ